MMIRGHWQRGVIRLDNARWGVRITRDLLSHSDEPFMLRAVTIGLCVGEVAYFVRSPFFWRVSKAKIARRHEIDWQP